MQDDIPSSRVEKRNFGLSDFTEIEEWDSGATVLTSRIGPRMGPTSGRFGDADDPAIRAWSLSPRELVWPPIFSSFKCPWSMRPMTWAISIWKQDYATG